MKLNLQEAHRLGLKNIMVEGDFLCAIKWAAGCCKPRWRLVDVAEEILDLARILRYYFFHVKRDANESK